jgi:putative flippase GtrA
MTSTFATLPLAKLARFAVVGFSLMGLHVALGYGFVKVIGMAPMAGSILAYLGAAMAGYIAQRIITFKSDTPHLTSLPRFATMIGLGLGVSWSAARIASAWGHDPMMGIIAASMLTPVANYFIMDRLVFPNQR